MVARQKKYASGEGAQFMTRKAALKKLQLSLKDFRRLCILKGIYPREPHNRKKAQKGAGGIKTLYHSKDIRFLLHEPIIWKLRDLKKYNQRIRKAKAMRERGTMNRYLRNHPEVKIDHIVKERYPTFVDAVRDLDDCLTLCFLFSTFPSLSKVPRERTLLCRRLTVEFMHAVIAAKALRYVFVSIKGYYYQAEIEGQTVTWIVPHNFGFQPQSKDEVDFKIMSTFVEFYTMMLGFVNFKLFHSLNIPYPPKLALESSSDADKCLVDEHSFVSEKIAAMNTPLVREINTTEFEEENAVDIFPDEDDPQKLEEAKLEVEKVKKLKNLFKGLKFFLNREVPRESLVFIIRCFGGEVSWDKLQFVGSTFAEDDETITHQVIDRPSLGSQYISRYYVQPQWIFDSVNTRMLLPVSKYLIGTILPPHLSPFIDKIRDQVYIPPEARALNAPQEEIPLNDAESEEEIEQASDEDQEDGEKSNIVEDDLEAVYKKEVAEDSQSEGDDSDAEDGEEESEDSGHKNKETKKKAMSVSEGQLFKEHPYKTEIEDKQAFRLREKMVKRKYQKLYKSMKEGRKERQKEIWLLRKKRRINDEKQQAERKESKKKSKIIKN